MSGLFISQQEIDATLGKSHTELRGKKEKTRYQIMPTKLFIETDRPKAFLVKDVISTLIKAGQYFENPQVQGSLPDHLAGPYIVSIFLKGQSDTEQSELLEGTPQLAIQGVMLEGVVLTAKDNFTVIHTKMVVPWKDIEYAGALDALSESNVMVFFESQQEELDLDAESTGKEEDIIEADVLAAMEEEGE